MSFGGAQWMRLATRPNGLRVVALLEPLLILAMGGVVLAIVLAIMMPIFELNQIIR